MGNLPKVGVSFSNGNLLQNIANIDGEACLVGTGNTGGNLNKVFVVNNLTDAETQGITVEAEPTAHRHISEFYEELGGNMELFVFLLVNTVTMAQMLDSTSITKASVAINAGQGKIGYLGIFRTPPEDYDGGDDYIDDDVDAALIASIAFTTAQNAQENFFTTLVEGRVNLANEANTTIFAPNTVMANFGHSVLGGSLNDGSASVGAALGRKVAYASNIKVGKVANGPLQIPQVYIGTKLLSAVTNLDALAGAGYLVFTQYNRRAGFYFGIDYMANTGDYSIWARAAVVNAAANIAIDVYTNDLESELILNADGTISESDASHLEDTIIAQEKFSLGTRISDFTAIVDRTHNNETDSTTPIKLRVLPNGYNSFIDLDLGLS